MLRGQVFIKKELCKTKHSSAMSNSALCDLNKDGTISKLHDTCPKIGNKSQKQLTFSPRRNKLEGSGFQNKLQYEFLKERKALGINF